MSELPPKLSKEQIESALKLVYIRRRRDYLKEHPICEACNTAPSEIIHHKITRKTHLIDVSVFMACCRPCERKFHVVEKKKKTPQVKQPLTHASFGTGHPRRKPCQFKSPTIGKFGGCWGPLELKKVFKGDLHVATYWLCARHRSMLLFGGQKLEDEFIRPTKPRCKAIAHGKSFGWPDGDNYRA